MLVSFDEMIPFRFQNYAFLLERILKVKFNIRIELTWSCSYRLFRFVYLTPHERKGKSSGVKIIKWLWSIFWSHKSDKKEQDMKFDQNCLIDKYNHWYKHKTKLWLLMWSSVDSHHTQLWFWTESTTFIVLFRGTQH